jgi:hypothetical protein
MFILLILICGLHQACVTISEKVDLHPLRPLYVHLIEFVGRVCIIPLIASLFLYYIAVSTSYILGGIIGSGIWMIAVLLRESFSIYRTKQISEMLLLRKLAEEIGLRGTNPFFCCLSNLIESWLPHLTDCDRS